MQLLKEDMNERGSLSLPYITKSFVMECTLTNQGDPCVKERESLRQLSSTPVIGCLSHSVCVLRRLQTEPLRCREG